MQLSTMRAALCGADDFPAEALEWARDYGEEATPTLLALLTACTTPGDITEEQANGAYFALPVLAGLHETRALPIVCALARNGDRIGEIFGDFATEDLHRMLVGIAGDEAGTLLAAARDDAIDPFVRTSFLLAWRWLSLEKGVAPAAMFDTLLALRETSRNDDDDALLRDEWARALIAADPDRAMPLVRKACETVWIDESLSDLAGYEEEAQAWHEDPVGQRDTFLAENGPIGDPVAFVERWIERVAQSHGAAGNRDEDTDDATLAPAVNRFRDVGRNDPCPCGSGKKFKKCCLTDQESASTL